MCAEAEEIRTLTSGYMLCGGSNRDFVNKLSAK